MWGHPTPRQGGCRPLDPPRPRGSGRPQCCSPLPACAARAFLGRAALRASALPLARGRGGSLAVPDHLGHGEMAGEVQAVAELSSGDGPLSVRIRPSSLKRDCDRRAMCIGQRSRWTYTRSHA